MAGALRVTGNSNTLAITDSAAQVNAALATLQITEAAASLSDLMTANGAEPVNNQLAVSLAVGAIITGNGTIEVGNFSESGRVSGAGTILITGNDALTVAAGSLTDDIVVTVQAGA